MTHTHKGGLEGSPCLSRSPSSTTTRRAIGVVRVSEVGDRDGASFASPGEQRGRIEAACERDGLRLLDVHEELDVSGGCALDKRPGLSLAVQAVEAGQAEVVIAAYFDRLVRSLEVQAELVRRVEDAGGQVLAVDVGRVTGASAGQWLSGTMLGAVSEYQRRTASERTEAARARAIARGVQIAPGTHLGYLRGDDGVLVVDPETAPVVLSAFKARAGGATITEVRDLLREHGVSRSFGGTQHLLESRTVLGEVHHGPHVNREAHPAVVPLALFERVQRARASRGRRAKSERLLARLGVAVCSSCGARLVVGTSNGYAVYRCPATSRCDARVSIAAPMLEDLVSDHVRHVLADQEGQASARQDAREAVVRAERAQAELDALIGMLDPLEAASRERLKVATAARDEARERVERLGRLDVALVVNAARDWPDLSIEARRALIIRVLSRVVVAQGRGTDRCSFEAFGE